jgi:transcriptional regulator with XRE-family HTH domain
MSAYRAHSSRMAETRSDVADRLKSLRTAAGISLQRMADLLQMPLGTYRHYEERFKEAYLPGEMVEKMLTSLGSTAISRDEILRFADVQGGLAEHSAKYEGNVRPPSSAAANVRAIMGSEDPAPQTRPELKFGSDGKYVQIIATVDKDGIDDLIRKLKTMKELLS